MGADVVLGHMHAMHVRSGECCPRPSLAACAPAPPAQPPTASPPACAAPLCRVAPTRDRPVRRVLVEDWDTFYSEAEKLYVEHPAHVSNCSPASAVTTR